MFLQAAAMANSPKESDPIDHLSNLPDDLLITILSFLPTHIAARTSVLCSRFRYLWEASPSLSLISKNLYDPQPEKFTAMAKHALYRRKPSFPLLSLHLEVSRCNKNAKYYSYLLAKARSFNLRHLTIEGCKCSRFFPIVPIIFTINSLEYLSLDCLSACINSQLSFPSKITLTCLRSLSLRLARIDPDKLKQLLSELCSLEDLDLHLSYVYQNISLSSQTIRKLKLIIGVLWSEINKVQLSLPSLKSLHLEIKQSFRSVFHIHGEIPLLRKAVINLYELFERDVNVVASMLNCISHVEELSLHLKENKDENYPIVVLLESGKDVPKFSKLKHLDMTICLNEHNFEAVTRMLHNCPVLESLKLVHEDEYTGFARGR